MPEDDLAPVGILPRPLQCGPTSSRMPVRASFRAELGIAARNGTSSLRPSPLIECARAPSRRACAQPDRLRHRSNQPASLSGRAPAVASSPCVGTVLAYGLSRRPQGRSWGCMTEYYFDGDPAVASTRRHLERVLKAPAPRRWRWLVGILAGSAALTFWRVRSRPGTSHQGDPPRQTPTGLPSR
jgi:hypothetical protein